MSAVDTRHDPPLAGSEVETLRGFLRFLRETFDMKTAGLDAAQLASPLPPSTMTLGGMLKHLAMVESAWLDDVMAGGTIMSPFDTAPWDDDGDWDWHSAADDHPDDLRGLWRNAVAGADTVIERVLNTPSGLDTISTGRSRGQAFSLRWILVHLIEEYARHNGHADLIREAIDGQTGE